MLWVNFPNNYLWSILICSFLGAFLLYSISITDIIFMLVKCFNATTTNMFYTDSTYLVFKDL